MESKRKIIGPIEMVVLAIALGLIAYILLKSSGGNVYESTENIQIVDNPDEKGRGGQIRNYEMQDEDRVEVILQQLSENYVDENNAISKERLNPDKLIPEDEMAYLEEVKKKHKEEETSISPSDWFAILQTSHKTYNKIKTVFEDADSSGKPVEGDNVSNMLENAIVAKSVYSKIEELFNIPEEDAKAFAEQGKKAVSDWAEFIEQNESKQGQ